MFILLKRGAPPPRATRSRRKPLARILRYRRSYVFEEIRPHDRLADDDRFCEGDAGERAELRVAAFDQLAKGWRGQSRLNGAAGRRRELTAIAVERRPLAIVVLRNVDDERG